MTDTSPTPYGSRQSGRRRAWDRQRKRALRKALRGAGAPRPEAVDAALVAGLRAALTAHGATAVRDGERAVLRTLTAPRLDDLLRGALENLRGREGVRVDQVTPAILARLGLKGA